MNTRKQTAIIFVILAPATIGAQQQDYAPTAAVPTHYDPRWMGEHTTSVTAVNGATLYFSNPWYVTTEYIDAKVEAEQEASLKARKASGSTADAEPIENFGSKLSLPSIQTGRHYDVFRLITVVSDSSKAPLEVKTVKVGDAVIQEIRQDVFLAKYSGQPIRPAEIHPQSFIIVMSRAR